MNKVAADSFYQNSEIHQWYNHRVLAVDGTLLMLPKHQSVEEEFGVNHFSPKADSPPMALGSMLYDVLNHLTTDTNLAPFNGSERDSLLGCVLQVLHDFAMPSPMRVDPVVWP